MRLATTDFLKGLPASESLEKGRVEITHLGGEWKCGSCGKTQGYDNYTCGNCGHDSAGPGSKHVFTKDHVKWYHDMEAKEAQMMPSVAKSFHVDRTSCTYGTMTGGRRCAEDAEKENVNTPTTDKLCGRHYRLASMFGGLKEGDWRDISHKAPSMAKSLGVQVFFDKLEKFIPCTHSTFASEHAAHPHVPPMSYQVGQAHEPREATHILENGGRQFPLCTHCAKRAEDNAYAQSNPIKLSPIKYGQPNRNLHPDVGLNAHYLRQRREEKQWRDGGHTSGNGPMEKSLGYQWIIDELRKSPRRTLKAPPEGMPESMHASWRAFDGVGPAVMRAWKNPNHEMHHAYLAKEWTRKNTNLKRYGEQNPSQHTPGWSDSPEGQKWHAGKTAHSTEMESIKQEHTAHMAKIAGQESLKHVPDHVAASREAYIKDKTSSFDGNGVKVGGSAHLNYDQGIDVINALGKYHRAGKMSENEHLRTQNFKERFHDAADSHEEKTGDYSGLRFPLAHVHPAMLELSHRAMQAHSENKPAKALIRHANDAADIHKP